MYRYKKGDVCPFCGQIIQTDDEDSLRLLSVTAAACRITPPEVLSPQPLPPEKPKKLRCTIQRCTLSDGMCCIQCSEYCDCVDRCLNHPDRCKLAKVME